MNIIEDNKKKNWEGRENIECNKLVERKRKEGKEMEKEDRISK